MGESERERDKKRERERESERYRERGVEKVERATIVERERN